MKALLLLALCATAHAALPPLPVVRPKPLLSPSHASQPKSKPMVRLTTIPGSTIDPSQPPKVPMTMEMAVVNHALGKYLFTASALQPPNNALSFEDSPVLSDWAPAAHFGPVPYEQTSFVSHYSNSEIMNVRARLTPIPPVSGQTQTGWMPASLVPVVGIAGKVYVNPALPGARAWSVRK